MAHPLGVSFVQLRDDQWIILYRAADTPVPPHCIHGHTMCVVCGGKVWLGNNSYDAVMSGVTPVCRPCSPAYATRTGPPVWMAVPDHLRVQGPH